MFSWIMVCTAAKSYFYKSVIAPIQLVGELNRKCQKLDFAMRAIKAHAFFYYVYCICVVLIKLLNEALVGSINIFVLQR